MKKKLLASFSLLEAKDFIIQYARKDYFDFRFKGDTFRDVLKERFIANVGADNIQVGVCIDKQTTIYLNVKKIHWYKNTEVCDIVIKSRSKFEYDYVRDEYFKQRRARNRGVLKDERPKSFSLFLDKVKGDTQ